MSYAILVHILSHLVKEHQRFLRSDTFDASAIGEEGNLESQRLHHLDGNFHCDKFRRERRALHRVLALGVPSDWCLVEEYQDTYLRTSRFKTKGVRSIDKTSSINKVTSRNRHVP